MHQAGRIESFTLERGRDEAMRVVARLDPQSIACPGDRCVVDRDRTEPGDRPAPLTEDPGRVGGEVFEPAHADGGGEAGGQRAAQPDREGQGAYATQARRRANGVVALERAGREVE